MWEDRMVLMMGCDSSATKREGFMLSTALQMAVPGTCSVNTEPAVAGVTSEPSYKDKLLKWK